MNCPPEIAQVLQRILQYGILNALSSGRENEAKAAALEADHVHNLPELLFNFSQRNLEYYWRVERVCYMRERLKFKNYVLGFDDLWARLENAMPDLSED